MTWEPILDHLESTHMLIGASKKMHQSVPYNGNLGSFSEGKKSQLSRGSLGEILANLPKI